MTHQYLNIERFNKLWSSAEIRRPIVILIGGYSGTGKSTLAGHIRENIESAQVITTGLVRSILQSLIPCEQNPYIHQHTYNLFQDVKVQRGVVTATDAFNIQINTLGAAIKKIVEFARSEKQHVIIDGNHVFPGCVDPQEDMIILEFYLKVTSREAHRRMLAGPTHNREIGDQQFSMARTFHDFLVQEASAKGKEVYEYSDSRARALAKIDAELGSLVA